MEENIEVKDVQKTEYLDKNGLDMLWAKVKENTNNQVEVERNRAVAKENSISDKVDNLKYLPYYNKYTESEIQYHKLADRDGIELESYAVHTKLSGDDIKIYSGSESSTINRSSISISNYGSDGNGNHFYVNTNSQPQLNLYDNESAIKATIYTNEHTPVISINEHTGSGRGDDLQLSANGIKMLFKTTKDIVTANNSTAHIGLDDDQTEYTYVAPLENGKVPEKYLDLPQIDTSDFVNKNTDEAQIINSPLAFTNEVVIASDMEDENTDYVALAPTELQFSENNYTSSIELNGKDTDANAECSIEINADHGNPLISLYSGNTDNGNDDSTLEITNSGISISNSQNENIGPDKVFATNGSVADLAQYVKKSEITAGGNVDDVQVNGVSVVENKIANIKPSTKESLGVVKVGDGLNVTDGVISVSAGNYLTYDSIANEQYYISSPKSFIFNGRNVQDSASSISNYSIIVGNNSAHTYSKMVDSYIQLRGDKNALNITYANITGNEYKGDDPTPYQQFVLDKQGVWLYGGDGNHVLTSNASTIDITQYALKSVYDEKIAALEARIAALEAKHIED